MLPAMGPATCRRVSVSALLNRRVFSSTSSTLNDTSKSTVQSPEFESVNARKDALILRSALKNRVINKFSLYCMGSKQALTVAKNKWKSMSEEEKQPYITLSQEIEAKRAQLVDEFGRDNPLWKMPKRLSQYGARDVFLAEKQVNASDLEQWKALDEAKRESYAAKAREIRENAALKYEEWYNSVDGKDLRKMNGMLAGAGLWKLFNPESENPESESKPPRPVLPFVRFFLELRSENPGIRIHDLSKVASAAWKELSSERKKEYTEAFQAEFKAWKENEALRKQEQEPRNKSKREKGQ